MKFGVFSVCTPEYDIGETVRLLADCGYDGVEWRVAAVPAEKPKDVPRAERYWSDNKSTLDIGTIADAAAEAKKLCDTTREALYAAIPLAVPGGKVGDIGAAVQGYCEARGYSLVREYTGHGVGRALHEDPCVPNVGTAGHGVKLRPGMAIAIEPMVNQGRAQIRVLPDQWTVVTRDGKFSAHFEHSVAITSNGPVILTLAED